MVTFWLSDFLTFWLSDFLTIWLSDYLTIWLSDYLTIWLSEKNIYFLKALNIFFFIKTCYFVTISAGKTRLSFGWTIYFDNFMQEMIWIHKTNTYICFLSISSFTAYMVNCLTADTVIIKLTQFSRAGAGTELGNMMPLMCSPTSPMQDTHKQILVCSKLVLDNVRLSKTHQ